MSSYTKVLTKPFAALLLTVFPLSPATIFGSSATAVSTVEGQLLMLECVAVTYNADQTLHFSHRASCLARAKREHGRLLFPTPNGTLQEITFDVFIDKSTHHLTDLSPKARDLLFKALQQVASTNSTVYVSVTGTFDPEDKWFNAISVKVLRTVANEKQMAISQ